MNSYRKMLRAKIHRATVTHADLSYEGSVSIPLEILEATGIIPHEAVQIWNVTSGTRLETYAIEGARNSGVISINGAAAHLVKPGEIIIIAAFFELHESEVIGYQPQVVFVDEHNIIKAIQPEIAGPNRRGSAVLS